MLILAIYFGLCVLFTSFVVYSIGGINAAKDSISEQVDVILDDMFINYGVEMNKNTIRNIFTVFFFLSSPFILTGILISRLSK